MLAIESMLTEARLASSIAPTLIKVGTNVATNLTDIETQFGNLVSGLEKIAADARKLDVGAVEADIGAAVKAGEKVYADVGLPQATVTAIAAHAATVPALSGLQSAIAAGQSIAKQLGLPV